MYPEDPKMEELRKTLPIPQIARLRGAMTQTKDIWTTERRKGQNCSISS